MASFVIVRKLRNHNTQMYHFIEQPRFYSL